MTNLARTSWDGEGPPIVTVHGLSSNASFYVGVAERLAGRRPLCSLDLLGRGRSERPEAGYGMAQHADDVAAVIDELDSGPAVVVGHSMGATVALTVAQRHPERCAGVVLYDGGPYATKAMATDQVAVGQFLEASRGLEGRLTTTFESADAYAACWRSLGIFEPEQWGPWVDAYLAADLEGLCSTAAMAEDIVDLLRIAGEPIAPVDVPVLAIAADSGLVDHTRPLVPDAAFDAMREALPSFRGERLTSTNHYTIALADPGASTTADLLIDFAVACGR